MAPSKVPDRISVSMGRKISDDSYGSFDFHYSYSTDVEPGEDASAAQDRAEDVVLDRLRSRVKQYMDRKKLKMEAKRARAEE